MYSINTNLSADNAARALSSTNNLMNVAMQQLSTGRTAVNAETADSALSITFATQSEGLAQAIKNAQTGINYLNVMASSVKETTLLVQKMKLLATQAQNAGYSADDRTQMNDEFSQLKTEINRNADSAKFNGESLINADGPGSAVSANGVALGASTTITATTDDNFTLNLNGAGAVNITLAAGTYTQEQLVTEINSKIAASSIGDGVTASLSGGKVVFTTKDKGASTTLDVNQGNATGVISADASYTGSAGKSEVFHVGYNTDAQNDISVNAHNLKTSGLGIDSVDITSTANAKSADDALSAALNKVSAANSEFRAVSGRISFTMDNLASIKQNTDSALSSVRDTDYAQTTTELSKQRVLQQAASAMLTQANHAPQQALQLLKG